MAYEVIATREFERDYKRLPAEVAERVNTKLDELAEHPEQLRFPLQHLPPHLRGLHKYRVGDYRLLLWPDQEKKRLVLYAIAHRREIYRRLRD
jgi:mRNA interferase RelE/StbE